MLDQEEVAKLLAMPGVNTVIINRMTGHMHAVQGPAVTLDQLAKLATRSGVSLDQLSFE